MTTGDGPMRPGRELARCTFTYALPASIALTTRSRRRRAGRRDSQRDDRPLEELRSDRLDAPRAACARDDQRRSAASEIATRCGCAPRGSGAVRARPASDGGASTAASRISLRRRKQARVPAIRNRDRHGRGGDVVGPAGQGIAAGEFDELVAASPCGKGVRERPLDEVPGWRDSRADQRRQPTRRLDSG